METTATLATGLEHEFVVARSAGFASCILPHHPENEETVIFGVAAKVDALLITQLIDQPTSRGGSSKWHAERT